VQACPPIWDFLDAGPRFSFRTWTGSPGAPAVLQKGPRPLEAKTCLRPRSQPSPTDPSRRPLVVVSRKDSGVRVSTASPPVDVNRSAADELARVWPSVARSCAATRPPAELASAGESGAGAALPRHRPGLVAAPARGPPSVTSPCACRTLGPLSAPKAGELEPRNDLGVSSERFGSRSRRSRRVPLVAVIVRHGAGSSTRMVRRAVCRIYRRTFAGLSASLRRLGADWVITYHSRRSCCRARP